MNYFKYRSILYAIRNIEAEISSKHSAEITVVIVRDVVVGCSENLTVVDMVLLFESI